MINNIKLKILNILGESYFYFIIYRIAYLCKVFFIIRPNISKSLDAGSISLQNLNTNYIKPILLVPLLETNHYMNFHVLALSKSFSLRGYEVIVIVCDEYLPACEIKNCRMTANENPCFKCSTNRKNLVSKFNLKTLSISSILSEIEDPVSYGKSIFKNYNINQKSFNTIVEDSVTRHFYGAESTFNKNEVKNIRTKHTETAYISLALGEILLKKYSPEITLNLMTVYSAWGPMNMLFDLCGVAPITVSMTPFNFRAIRLNNPDIFKHRRTFKRFLKNRNGALLNNDENAKLDNFLSIRKLGNDKLMKEWGYFQQSAIQDLAINNNKKNVFLFTNIPWDQGLNEFAGIFEDVMDWVYRTIEHFKDNKDIDIWIKPHPAEVRGTSKSGKNVSDFIKLNYPKLPKNIHLIDADLGISPYSLFEHIDVGVVLTGTLGLEMSLENIPVISAGINPCYGLGLLSEPVSEEEYFEAITEIIAPKNKLNDLRLFCYFYFIHQCFTWPLTKRSFGNDFTGYEFNSVNELRAGKISDLDIIFDEIENLVKDFKANHNKANLPKKIL